MKRIHSSSARRGAVVLTASIAWATVCPPGLAGAGTSTEVDVMAWLAAVSPAISVDRSNDCMAGATDAVAYRNDRIVVRSGVSDADAAAVVNGRLHAMYGNNVNYAGAVERVTFPTPPGRGPIVPVLSISLSPRGGEAAHDVLTLARRLRREDGLIASPDYGLTNDGPYTHYFPYGYPERIAALAPPRNTLTPAGAPVGGGLPIGSGVKIEVYDTGLFAADPVNLPTTSQLRALDDDRVDRLGNGPKMVDYPAAGHAQAISGVLTTTSPGAVIENVRINDRSGLATDVSAARNIASSLSTLTIANYPNLLITAFGTPGCDLDPLAPGGVLQPLGMEAVVDVVDQFDPAKAGGMLVVASAGNVASSRPHYPAAFASVLSVGALDGTVDSDADPWSSASRTAPIADFSNRGATVDVYATGVDLPTTHVNGYRFEVGGNTILGKASVSGTSFAAPQAAAYIAEMMSTTGGRARAARDVLIAAGARPLPQCGTTTVEKGVAIVLVDSAASINDRATIGPVAC